MVRKAGLLSYKKGVLNGKKCKWDDTGRVIEDGDYVDGKLEGRYFQINSAQETIITHFHEGKKEGVHQIFYAKGADDKEVKRLEATFKGDLLEGEVVEYAESGAKVAVMPYRAGKLHGQAALYTEEGHLTATVDYVDNKREGKAVTYYPSGKLMQQVTFHGDQREGEELSYLEDGRLAARYGYQKDKLHGLCQEWNSAGHLVFEAEYQIGKRHGKFNKYYEDGSPRLRAKYAEDRLIGEKELFKPKSPLKSPA